MTKETFSAFETKPLIASILPSVQNLASVPVVQCKYGLTPNGSILSYQQKLLQDYFINDYSCTNFPKLPLDIAETRFMNNIFCFLIQQ